MKKSILLFACLMTSVAYAQSEEWEIIANKSGKYGFMDQTGATKIPFIYDFADSFSEGLAEVRKGSDFFSRKAFYINKQGECVEDW